jgi:hypothetical protein
MDVVGQIFRYLVSGNRKPEVIDKYVTSYDGVAYVYIFLDTLYFWVEDRACIKTTEKN